MKDGKILIRICAALSALAIAVVAHADTIRIVNATPNHVEPGQTLTVALEESYGSGTKVAFPCPLTLTVLGGTTPLISDPISAPPNLFEMAIPATTPMGTYILRLTCSNGLTATAPSPITIEARPVIQTFGPSPAPGSEQTVGGNWFGATRGKGFLYFVDPQHPGNTFTVTNVSSWSNTSITYTLPIVATGTYQMSVVTDNNGNSLSVQFPIIEPELQGWVDLHTHPLANLGFGGKLYYGNPDFDPVNGTGQNGSNGGPCAPMPVLVNNLQLALGPENWVQGGYGGGTNPCGDVVGWPADSVRYEVILQTETQNGAQSYLNGTFTTSGFQGQEAAGVQDFPTWPQWNDITHQKMFVDWIRRAHDGGLRVLVALAVNSKTLGDMTAGGSGMPGQGNLPANDAAIPTCNAATVCAPVQPRDWPTDDKTSADLQIQEIKNFVNRHSDFMEVALSSADVKRIVAANKVAVIIGVEVNNIGNFGVVGVDPGTIRTLQGGFQGTGALLGATLFGATGAVAGALVGGTSGGVLGFIFGGPIGAIVGAAGGAATAGAGTALVGAALGAQEGLGVSFEVGQVTTGASVLPTPPGLVVKEIDRLYSEGVRYIFPIHLADNPLGGTAAYEDLFNWANVYEEGHGWALKCANVSDNVCYVYNSANTQTPSLTSSNPESQLEAVAEQLKLGFQVQVPPPIACFTADQNCKTGMVGNMNSQPLTSVGQCAIQEMMSKGMLIDIDHMSDAAADQTITLAQHQGIGYPLNSGHNSVREASAGGTPTERNLSPQHYGEIGALHGMAGVGSVNVDACGWMDAYNQVVHAMSTGNENGTEIVAGFGTDQVLAAGMPPRLTTKITEPPTAAEGGIFASYQKCTTACETPPKGGCSISTSSGNQSNGGKSGTGSGNARTGNGENQGVNVLACAACQKECLTLWGKTTITVPICNGVLAPSNVQYNSPSLPLAMSSLGNQKWDYNQVGVAHYGMIPDFLADVSQLPAATPGGPTGADVVAQVNRGAQYFYLTWQRAESIATAVSVPESCMEGLQKQPACPSGESLKVCGSQGTICVNNSAGCPAQPTQCPAGKVAMNCGPRSTICYDPSSPTKPHCP